MDCLLPLVDCGHCPNNQFKDCNIMESKSTNCLDASEVRRLRLQNCNWRKICMGAGCAECQHYLHELQGEE